MRNLALLHLAQGLLQLGQAPQLVVLTRGAQRPTCLSPGAASVASLASGGAWGLTRVLQLEAPQKLDTLWSFIKSHLQQKTIVFLSSCKQVTPAPRRAALLPAQHEQRSTTGPPPPDLRRVRGARCSGILGAVGAGAVFFT